MPGSPLVAPRCVLGPLNDAVLHPFAQVNEAGAIPGHSDDQVLVVFRGVKFALRQSLPEASGRLAYDARKSTILPGQRQPASMRSDDDPAPCLDIFSLP